MEIDSMIIARLGERERKLQLIKEFQRVPDSYAYRKYGFYGVSAVACVIIILISFSGIYKSNSFPDISMQYPNFSEYRGSLDKGLEEAVNSNNYMEALNIVDEELHQAEVEYKRTKETYLDHSEESLYLIGLEKDNLENLYWIKIYLLVKTKNRKELEQVCRQYLQNNDFQIYRGEVEGILKKIK